MRSISVGARCFIMMLMTAMAISVSAANAAAPPETLELQDLQGRPDRWPAEITIKRELNFGDAVLSEGQKVTVIEYNGGPDVGVSAAGAGSNELFGIDVADCDLLEAANAAWAKLTPEQRALEPDTVVNDASLWPAKVKCTSGFVLNSGKEIPPGGEFELMTIEPNGEVVLWEPEGKAKLGAQVAQTDVVARARELVILEPAHRPARVAAALKDVMIDSDGKPVTKDALDDQTIFALYYGASWCGPCRSFSPGFVQYINSVAKDNPKLTVLIVSNDEQDADLLKYMKEEQMPFAAVPMKAMSESGLLMAYLKGSIPQLTILDRHGKVLADSWDTTRYVGPKVAMAGLDKLIKEGAAK